LLLLLLLLIGMLKLSFDLLSQLLHQSKVLVQLFVNEGVVQRQRLQLRQGFIH
jgi:hypothetical protein